VKYMNTKDMIADILTKPLQGEPFRVLRDELLKLVFMTKTMRTNTCMIDHHVPDFSCPLIPTIN
jgi:hypothetical protein